MIVDLSDPGSIWDTAEILINKVKWVWSCIDVVFTKWVWSGTKQDYRSVNGIEDNIS